jgi:hypothetical protein
LINSTKLKTTLHRTRIRGGFLLRLGRAGKVSP